MITTLTALTIPFPRLLPAEPDGPVPQFVSPSTGNIFQLNTTMVEQAEARAVCNQQGGHLAIYWTVQEQVRTAAATDVHRLYFVRIAVRLDLHLSCCNVV
jgi:hypothetical protein